MSHKKRFLPAAVLALAAALAGCAKDSSSARHEVNGADIRPPAATASNTVARNDAASGGASADEIPVYGYEVVNSWPHDPTAYTQGLVFHEGTLFESTGLTGESSLRQVDLETGTVRRKTDLPRPYFGEGLTVFRGKLYQLTWLSHKGFIYDLDSFKQVGEFSYEGEGWGLTHDGQSLIMSDGTNEIRFLNPESFQIERKISVFQGDKPLMQLNELEYIKGEIYANIYQTDLIARIDPKTGRLAGLVDLKGLLAPQELRKPIDVLNGIAYDGTKDRIVVTGKLWPRLFEIRLKRKG
jgi:glutamine cyclotransferase